MATEGKFSPQVREVSPFYNEIKNRAKPLLEGERGSKEEAMQVFDLFKKAPGVLVSSLRNLPEDQTRVKNAVLEDRMDEAESRLKELYSAEFGPKGNEFTSDYYSILEKAYATFLDQYAGDLENPPRTFGELVRSTLKEKSKETLRPETVKVLPEDVIDTPEELAQKAKREEKPIETKDKTGERKEAQKPPVSSAEDDDPEFTKWKQGWFEDDGKDYAKGKSILTQEDINEKLNDFNELRDAALQRIRIMYMTNEIDEESDRRIRLDDFIVRAEYLAEGQKDKQKYVDYFRDMVNALRETNLYWLEHWIGTTGNGIGVKMESIATGAAKLPDSPHEYFAFLMKDKSIIDAYHMPIVGTDNVVGSHKELSGGQERSSLAKIVGYRLRRMTGQAIYDGLRKLNENDFIKIARIIEASRMKPPGFDDSWTEEVKNVKLKEFNEEINARLANAVFGINSDIKPHTIDYQLFLNHFIPWYLTVRYREKFKTNVDRLYQESKHLQEEFRSNGYKGSAIPSLMTEEDYDKLGRNLKQEFDHFNIGEIGAYSLWKRPDTSGLWINNLKFITFVGQVYVEKEDSGSTKNIITTVQEIEKKDKEEIFHMENEIKIIKSKNENILSKEEILKQEEKLYALETRKKELEMRGKGNFYKKTIEIFKSFEGDSSGKLSKFLEKGADLGMKMMSLYDAKHDDRAKQTVVVTDWAPKFTFKKDDGSMDSIKDWTWSNLQTLSLRNKLNIMSVFLDENKINKATQNKIIRNNLIRTVPINEELRSTLKLTDAAFSSYFDSPIYEEFIDLDDLYLPAVDGKHGESWMRLFDKKGFSHNAFVIYEGYASKTREVIHEIFDVTTPLSNNFKLKEVLRSAKAFKHNVDTALAEVSPETGMKEYKHAVSWRIERTLDSIEDYVSSMYMLSIAAYRKMGTRVPLAEQVNQMVSSGVKEAFFKRHHFEPAMSKRQKDLGLEFTYQEVENHQKMGNDFKLRYLLNQLGFEGDEQKIIWEEGYLAKLNAGKEENDPTRVRYETILLMAGLKEREGNFDPGEVRGYEIDDEIANAWFGFYQQHGGDRLPKFEFLEQYDRSQKGKFVPTLLERARKTIPGFSTMSDEQIKENLGAQFATLHERFNDRTMGLFTGIMSYQRNLAIIYEQVIDSYVQNTFDKDKRYLTDEFVGEEKWPEREWDARVDYMRREAYKCAILRKRKYAIKDDNEGFNKFILTQTKRDEKTKKPIGLYQYFDRDNWDINYETGEQKMLDKAGTDEIESWLMGSGEHDFGEAKRLTRLPNYWNALGYYHLYRTIFSPGVAIEAHVNSRVPEWESGEIRTMKDGRRVKLGPWTWVMNPEKWYVLLRELRDPGGESIFGWDEINEINEKDGTTQEQVNSFVEERNWRKVADLEEGLDKSLLEKESENFEFLDAPASLLIEFPDKIGPEIGGILGLKKAWTKIRKAGMVGTSAAVANGVLFTGVAGTVLAAAGLGPLGYVVAGAVGAGAFTNPTVDYNDEDKSKRPWVYKILFDLHLPWWKRVSLGSSRIEIGPIKTNIHYTQLPILGGTIFGSINNIREMGRDSDVMLKGKEPIWDDLVAIGGIIKDFKENKEKLRIDADYFSKGAH